MYWDLVCLVYCEAGISPSSERNIARCGTRKEEAYEEELKNKPGVFFSLADLSCAFAALSV